MRTLLVTTALHNRIPIEDGDSRSNDEIILDYRNDPSSFPRDDQPTIDEFHSIDVDLE